ncbi:MAG: hypothetical protein LBU05_05895 [Bifidobacteriaceae bacterium]|nr:hypothetical protein [Bifidobacteriaceae bacterium]
MVDVVVAGALFGAYVAGSRWGPGAAGDGLRVLVEELCGFFGCLDVGLLPGVLGADPELDSADWDGAVVADFCGTRAVDAASGWARFRRGGGDGRSGGFGPGRVGGRGRVPCLAGRDALWQGLVGALGVLDVVEGVHLGLEFAREEAKGCLSNQRNRVWWKRSFLSWMVGLWGLTVIGSTPSDFR